MTDSPRRDGSTQRPTQPALGNGYPGYTDPGYAQPGPRTAPPTSRPRRSPPPYRARLALVATRRYGYDPYATGQYGAAALSARVSRQPPPEGPQVTALAVDRRRGRGAAGHRPGDRAGDRPTARRQQTVVAPLPSLPEPSFTTAHARRRARRRPPRRHRRRVRRSRPPATVQRPDDDRRTPGAPRPSSTTSPATGGPSTSPTSTPAGAADRVQRGAAVEQGGRAGRSPPRTRRASASSTSGREVTCSITVNGVQVQQRTGTGPDDLRCGALDATRGHAGGAPAPPASPAARPTSTDDAARPSRRGRCRRCR